MKMSPNLFDEENQYYDLTDSQDSVDEIDPNTLDEEENDIDEETTTEAPKIKDLQDQKHSYIVKFLNCQLKVLEFNRDVVSLNYKDQLFVGKVLDKISNSKFVFLNTSTNAKKLIDVDLL